MRVGIMSMAHMHGRSYAAALKSLPGVEFTGIADHDAERASSTAEHYGVKAFASYDELLADKPDAVIICSENINHRPLTEKSATAGVHVMCEKPLATTIEDGLAMIAACKTAGVQLMTAFPCRFSPATVRLRTGILDGRLGKILAIRATNRGKCPYGWFVKKGLSGGGAVIDHTVHATDLMRWLLGTEVVEVYAEIDNKLLHQDFEDTGFLTMEFSDGVFATLDTSWSRPTGFPTWGDVTLSVVGDKGVVSLDMFSQNLVHYSNKTGAVTWEPWGSNVDELMVAAFVDAIRTGKPVPVTGEDGLRAAAVALAAYESAEKCMAVAPASF
ncbi:MAG: Gfo/Idh/MocA family oxidoreductase [Chthonomonadales bacterium]